ncbi:MAG: DNA-3-methyladenine glycosylase, partial [Bdellovibrionaceae bacterium]|nr:DNA-3-methyladenine glycosylase [Pseudobdellovibrionaceae bacterium]
MTSPILPPRFYADATERVARRLLGQRLVHVINGERLSGLIVETEAYLGARDRACHTYGYRRTTRVQSMYLPGGHAYVYFIYGMHFCFNAVTRDTVEPEAVLIRALIPDEGLATQKRLRGTTRERELTNGPARLCQALAIARTCDGLSLQGPELFIEQMRGRM